MATKFDEYGGWRGLFLYSLISALISGAVIGGILKWLFDKELESWRSQRTWQVAALSEVIAPAVMHFERTGKLGNRYRLRPLYGEAVLLRESNNTVRTLLLSKAHLLPSELVTPSGCLLTHYDIWLKRFDQTFADYKRIHGSEPPPDAEFDVGSSEVEDKNCGKFPQEVPTLFRLQFNELRKQLYGLDPPKSANSAVNSDVAR